MLRARNIAIGRLAAALLTLLLSGVPRVVAVQAPAAHHRCACHHHPGQECHCALCRRAVTPAHPSSVRCHDPPTERAPTRSDSPHTTPCFEGTCGGGSGPTLLSPAGVDFFCPPPGSGVRGPWGGQEPWPTVASGETVERREPDTPPPRRVTG